MEEKTLSYTSIKYILATVAALATATTTELLNGRDFICKCGYIKLWTSQLANTQNSQHSTDWYTFSHIIHGFAFYYLGKLFKKLTLFQTFLLALGLETFWEILENSPLIINRYQETTISGQYNGDSIINSAADILAMTVGFYLAKKLPGKAIIMLIIAMELLVGYFIKDNLTLNIIMLIYPIEAIKKWQLGM